MTGAPIYPVCAKWHHCSGFSRVHEIISGFLPLLLECTKWETKRSEIKGLLPTSKTFLLTIVGGQKKIL